MLPVTNDFRRQLINDNRDYVVQLVNFTLADGTVLETITNDKIWDGGISFDEATSNNSSFDIGSAVIGSCKVVLNDINEEFSTYDFFNATFTLYVGLQWTVNGSPHTEMIQKGFYTVDSATYNGSLITLNCLDNMWRFDIPFEDITVTYPLTARELIVSMCQNSAIGLSLDTQSFPNYSTMIQSAPEKEMNCREVLANIAQICCCYAKINPYGNLELKWYDISARQTLIDIDGGTFAYNDGDSADGGDFGFGETTTYDGGTFQGINAIAYLSSNSSMSVGTDDIQITGIRVLNENEENGYDVTVGESGYILTIQNNPFITKTNAQAICNQIFNGIDGLILRTFTASSLSDVSIETGDICYVNDFRGNRFISYITNLSFTTGAYEQFSCSAQSPQKNLTVKYDVDVQTLVEAEKQTNQQIGTYDQAVQRMNKLASNAGGLYWGEAVQADGSSIYYQSNRPLSNASDGSIVFVSGSHVWKYTSNGFFSAVSSGTTDATTSWTAGIDNNNNAVMSTVSAIGISADWITAGSISADRMQTNVITAINNVNAKCRVTLNANSLTESSSFDYLTFYYTRDGVTYGSANFGGASIGGASYVLPTSDFYVYWHSDSSAHNYYGFKIDSVVTVDDSVTPITFTQKTLPSVSVTDVGSNYEQVQTTHPYSDNENKMWKLTVGGALTINAARLDLNGYITASSLSTAGATVINGGNITTGTISGITLISDGGSTNSKIEISNGEIRGYYNDVLAGTIKMGYDSSTDMEVFRIDSDRRVIIKSTGKGIALNGGDIGVDVKNLGVDGGIYTDRGEGFSGQTYIDGTLVTFRYGLLMSPN